MERYSGLVVFVVLVGGMVALTVWKRHWVEELHRFLSECKHKLKKVTWPGQKEVWWTTIVVVATVFVFGFFLSAVDVVFAGLRTYIFKALSS